MLYSELFVLYNGHREGQKQHCESGIHRVVTRYSEHHPPTKYNVGMK